MLKQNRNKHFGPLQNEFSLNLKPGSYFVHRYFVKFSSLSIFGPLCVFASILLLDSFLDRFAVRQSLSLSHAAKISLL